jgi:hypothetical protein
MHFNGYLTCNLCYYYYFTEYFGSTNDLCYVPDVADALVGVGIIVNSESMPGMLMLDKDYNNMSKFLNRILGMPVDLQNRLFQYFTDTLQAIVTQAKKTGRYDMGILGKYNNHALPQVP